MQSGPPWDPRISFRGIISLSLATICWNSINGICPGLDALLYPIACELHVPDFAMARELDPNDSSGAA